MAQQLTQCGDQIIISVTVNEWQQWKQHLEKCNQPAPADITLPIPHHSQLGPHASQRRNDCGAACVAMIINGLTSHTPTVDQIATTYQQNANKYMTFSELITALTHYGLKPTYQRPITTTDIHTHLTNGRPLIALVKYPHLPTQFTTFTGSHFITLYGQQNGHILYHDPLAPPGTAVATTITPAQLQTAMSAFQSGENLPHQALIINQT